MQPVRLTVLAALVLAVVVAGVFVGPVAADHAAPQADNGSEGEENRDDAGSENPRHESTPDNGSEGEVSGEVTTTENSTLRLYQAVGANGDGGWMLVECEGNTTLTHECDKSGELDAGPVSVDYEGDNHGNPPGMYGGGGDEVTVSTENRSATGEFDCDLRTSNLPQSCTVNGSSSETGGTSLP